MLGHDGEIVGRAFRFFAFGSLITAQFSAEMAPDSATA